MKPSLYSLVIITPATIPHNIKQGYPMKYDDNETKNPAVNALRFKLILNTPNPVEYVQTIMVIILNFNNFLPINYMLIVILIIL
jgi:hypothetical protein